MISLAEALAAYPANLTALPATTVALEQALHRVLRAPALARCDLPRFSQSALDGYVLTNEDAAAAPCTLAITDAIAAGDGHALKPLRRGECQRILTGARVPPNAGAVVAQERVNVTNDAMTLGEPLKNGANIRWQGEELREGATLGDSGQRLTPGHLAALAAAGVDALTATRTPRIRVLVSGDEIKPVGTPLLDGQIWDANGPLVLSWLRARGYDAELHYVGDTRAAVEAALADVLAHSDLVITTGGVSVGDKDYILPVAESLGVHRVFWQVAQKPGKPIYFGTFSSRLLTRRENRVAVRAEPVEAPDSAGISTGSTRTESSFLQTARHSPESNTVLIGLPGNPGAVLIGLTLHVRAVLDVLEGTVPIGASFHPGILAAPVKADARRDCLSRMQLQITADGRAELHPLPHQDSHMLSNLASANVLVHLPSQAQAYAAGALVRWTWL